jgi:hypothetical protein
MCVCVLITAGPSTKCVDQTGWNTKKHPGFRILLCFALIALPASPHANSFVIGPAVIKHTHIAGVCRTYSEVGHLVVARGTGWG